MPRWPIEQTAAVRRAIREWLIAQAALSDAEWSGAEIAEAVGFDIAKVNWILQSMQTNREIDYRYIKLPRGGRRRILWRLPVRAQRKAQV